MRCSTTTSVRSPAAPTIASRTDAAVDASSIEVGSSSSSRSGCIASTPASASRCCSPPDSADVKWSRPYVSPTASSDASTRDQISSRASPGVLGTERDVAADALGDDGVGGILQQQAEASADLGACR